MTSMFRNKDHLAKMTGQRAAPSTNQAQAAEYFEQFINASSLKNLLGYFRTMCELLHLRPTYYNQFYPKLKSSLNNWKAKAIWKKLDARANHKCYAKGKIGEKTRVLIIGAGPCGLRTAIEAQLLGAKVVIIEKRDKLSRNNVLHLWPFVIEDLRTLGAKKFFGKFCAGAIDHISIRQLQCILFKVALILGVEIHTEVSFEGLVQPDPTEKIGWRAELEPENHPVSQYEFDVIIGADGKRNTLQGFKRKEFRGKLAIAITANFINKRTEAEARVEEISGVAFIFNQKFFKDLYQETGIDLENIVYYKDDTHYFVMTAKKPSLLEKGVIIQDLADTERLLAPDNVNREALLNYAKEAAEFSTHYQLPDLEFAVNHYGQPDVAMFDFTSMYAAENASKIIERHGYQLLMILVGDSLLEPFWPTGSGCARGFLSALDAAWSIRSWSMGKSTPLEVLAERESIYRLLAQTTPDNLNKDWKSYTLDPSTRYPNLNRNQVTAHQVVGLFDTDDIQNIEKVERLGEDSINAVGNARKRRRDNVDTDVLINWVKNQLKNHEDIEITDMTSIFHTGKALCAIVNRYRPDLLDYSTIVNNKPSENNHLVIDILEKDLGIPPIMTGEEMSQTEDLLTLSAYLTQIYDTFRTEIPHVKHPKLELPESKMASTSFKTIMQNTQAHLNIGKPSSHKRHLDVSLSAKHSNLDRKARKKRSSDKIGTNIDHESKLPVQRNTDEDFAAKIKNMEDRWNERPVVDKKPKDLLRSIGKIETSDWNIKEIEKKIKENKLGKPINKDREKVPKWSREQFVARQTKLEKLDRQDSSEAKYADIDKNIRHLELKLKEGTNRDLGQNKVATITEKLVSKIPEKTDTVVQKTNPQPAMIIPTPNASEFCHFCKKRVYLMERLSAEGRFFHHGCFKCQYCKAQLRLGSYAFDKDGIYDNKFFCLHHYGMQGELPSRVSRKPSQRRSSKKLLGVAGVDLLDRVQTPERVEFSNLSVSRGSSDQEEEMDEDEWTDRNFGASTAELDSSDEESSSYSDSDSDGEDAYEEAMEEPVTKEGTMKWAERMNKRHYSKHCRSDSDEYSSSDSSSYYENTTDDDDSDTATEGEEEIKARELRLQEVRLEPPIILNDTGTDTEVNHNLEYTDNSNLFPCRDTENLPNLSSTGSNNSLNNYASAISDSENAPEEVNLSKGEKNMEFGEKPDLVTKSKQFGPEFIPKFKPQEPESILVIKRTPSKINLPKEVNKPKVAVNINIPNTKKYFGEPKQIKKLHGPRTLPPKKIEKRLSCDDVLQNATGNKKKLVSQNSFNFEPEDQDLENLDNYIENLLQNEEELMKPVDPNKFKSVKNEDSLSSDNSIEDLIKALETETSIDESSTIDSYKQTNEKINEFLKWLEDLDHDEKNSKLYESGEKYQNLEKVLKTERRLSAVSKLNKENINYFDKLLAGKSVEAPDESVKRIPLVRSKTEIHFDKPRTSVDLDAVSNVDIKKVRMKFEQNHVEGDNKIKNSNVLRRAKTIHGRENMYQKNLSTNSNTSIINNGSKYDSFLSKMPDVLYNCNDNKNITKYSNSYEKNMEKPMEFVSSVKVLEYHHEPKDFEDLNDATVQQDICDDFKVNDSLKNHDILCEPLKDDNFQKLSRQDENDYKIELTAGPTLLPNENALGNNSNENTDFNVSNSNLSINDQKSPENNINENSDSNVSIPNLSISDQKSSENNINESWDSNVFIPNLSINDQKTPENNSNENMDSNGLNPNPSRNDYLSVEQSSHNESNNINKELIAKNIKVNTKGHNINETEKFVCNIDNVNSNNTNFDKSLDNNGKQSDIKITKNINSIEDFSKYEENIENIVTNAETLESITKNVCNLTENKSLKHENRTVKLKNDSHMENSKCSKNEGPKSIITDHEMNKSLSEFANKIIHAREEKSNKSLSEDVIDDFNLLTLINDVNINHQKEQLEDNNINILGSFKTNNDMSKSLNKIEKPSLLETSPSPPARRKHKLEKPPQRPERKKSQTSPPPSILKKEKVTSHELPKVQKVEIQNVDSLVPKEKECSIQ